MTAKQYYKQTSDMAWLIDDYTVEHDRVHARILITVNGLSPEDILKENDFFALKDFKGQLTTDNPKFDITFIIDSKHYDVYDLTVCDIIDCRCVEGGELVVSCSEYTLVESITEPDEVAEDAENKKSITVTKKSPFDNMFGFGFDFPNITIPSFDNFFSKWDKHFEDLKNCGGKYCSVTCKVDGNGNGYYCKVDNDGVVEKTFKKVGDEIKEVENKSDSKKTLKDLI